MTDRHHTRPWHRRCRRSPAQDDGTDPLIDVRRVQALIDGLDLSKPITPNVLADELAQRRGKPIKIQPYPRAIVRQTRDTGEPLPYGAWVSSPAADYIFYRGDTSPAHQQHIILHELGHLYCRHNGVPVMPTSFDGGTPTVAVIAEAVKRADGFEADQELVAEWFAYLIERKTRSVSTDPTDFAANRYRILED